MQNSNTPSNAVEGSDVVIAPSAEIEQLLEQVRNEHEMYLRALADFDNYRRRVERESERAVHDGKREIILSLLDVLDGFELAREHMNDAPPSLLDGVQAIYRKLQRVLEAQGVTPFESRGEPFDPKLHEAVASIKEDMHAPGTVVDQVQRGYRWGDELLRPARVRVAA
jgi:molecular chaperone GrpE